jgi:hypothetical protein
LSAYTAAYAGFAGALAFTDVGLTAYLLENNPDAFEMNVMVDTSGMSSLLTGAATVLLLFTLLFTASLAMCLAGGTARRILQINSRWDEVFVRVPGATALWYLIGLIGAVLNNAGLILYELAWLQELLGLFGVRSSRELMAGFMLYSLVSFAALIVPSFLLFSAVADRAGRSLRGFDADSQTA